ncbi:MAG: N-acyl homoserine lactonase family protein [Thermoleophilaceae bacterium]
MATAAEPRPAELPLPGGRPGAAVRLHPLLAGRAVAPPAYLLREPGRLAGIRALGLGVSRDDWVPIPIVAFLLEHPGAGQLLIDTGLHPSVAVSPAENFGRVGARAFRDLQMEAAQALPAQLRERGIDPARVGTVVMTHLHVDHASGISQLPEATFVVSRAEWEAATSQGQLHGYMTRQFDHAFDYRLLDVEGDTIRSHPAEPGARGDTIRSHPAEPGARGQAPQSFSGFARSFDLFGDGSVRAVYTPGHTLGHMSVVVRTAGGEVLVAGDAVYSRRALDESHLPHRTEDEHLYRRSLREMQQYLRETPDAVVIPGHDWEEWQKLEAAY